MSGFGVPIPGNVGKTPIGDVLDLGLDTLSYNQELTFLKFIRIVSPLDGMVWLVRSGLVETPTTGALNGIPYASLPDTLTVKGSLHFSTNLQQEEAESPGISSIVFTAQDPVEDFVSLPGSVLYIVDIGDGVMASFSSRTSYYRQATLHQYTGEAVYPFMKDRIITSLEGFSAMTRSISNSLPVWLAIASTFPVYPSYLVPQNIVPPYAAVHIPPESTEALQSAPWSDPATGSRYQLMREMAKITFYGVPNDQALDYVNQVYETTLVDLPAIGLMNPLPALRDEKKTQRELQVLALKKSIEFNVSYLQTRILDVALQFFEVLVVSYSVGGGPYFQGTPIDINYPT
jgi:hypothetical protein